MKAIFAGSLLGGFSLLTLTEDDTVPEFSNAMYREALEVRNPSELDHSVSAEDGDFFVVFTMGLAQGFSVYGPFPDHPSAMTFGESNREAGAWEVFDHSPF